MSSRQDRIVEGGKVREPFNPASAACCGCCQESPELHKLTEAIHSVLAKRGLPLHWAAPHALLVQQLIGSDPAQINEAALRAACGQPQEAPDPCQHRLFA